MDNHDTIVGDFVGVADKQLHTLSMKRKMFSSKLIKNLIAAVNWVCVTKLLLRKG